MKKILSSFLLIFTVLVSYAVPYITVTEECPYLRFSGSTLQDIVIDKSQVKLQQTSTKVSVVFLSGGAQTLSWDSKQARSYGYSLDSLYDFILEKLKIQCDTSGRGISQSTLDDSLAAIRNYIENNTYIQTDSSIITDYVVLASQNAPPVSPTTGDTYLVGNSPSGAWVGHAKDIAEWNGSSWDFTDAVQGNYLYNTANALTYIFRSGSWVQTTGIPALNNGNSISSGLTIGTNNLKSLNFETNNAKRGRIDSSGNWHINANLDDTTGVKILALKGDKVVKVNNAFAGSGGGSTVYAANGLTKRNDTIFAGGKIKDAIVFTNSTDTLMGIDSTGALYLMKIGQTEEEGFHIDSNLVAVRNTLLDSVIHWVFNDDATKVCYADSAGTTGKIIKRDNNRLVIDTTNFGSCTGVELFTMLSWRVGTYNVPYGFYVDTFSVFFSGYDTLNMEGDASGEDKGGYWFVSDGHKTLDDPNGVGYPFSQLGNPYIITGDTISFMNRYFNEKKTHIDSLFVSVLIPVQAMEVAQQIIDRIAFVYTLKPYSYTLGLQGNRVVKMNTESSNSSTAMTAGNGIGIDGNSIKLGNLTDETVLSANNHQYQMIDISNYSISANSAAYINGAQVTITSQTGNIDLNPGNGRDLELKAGNGSGGSIVLNSNSSDGIFVSGAPQDDNIPWLLGSYANDGSQQLEWRSASSLLGTPPATIYTADGALTENRTFNLANNKFTISSAINPFSYGTEFVMENTSTNYKTRLKHVDSDFGLGINEGGGGGSNYMWLGTVPDNSNGVVNGNYNPVIKITRLKDFVGSGHDFTAIDIEAGGISADTTAKFSISTNQNSAYIQMVATTNHAMSSPLASQSLGIVIDTMFQIFGPALNNTDPRYVVTGSGNVGSGEILTFTDVDSLLSIPNLQSGMYLPVESSVTNCTMGIIDSSMYSRVGNVVTVSGTLRLTVGSAISASFILDLPISSTCTDSYQLTGTCVTGGGVSGSIWGTTGGMAAQFNIIFPASATDTFLRYTFQYQVR